MGYLNFSGTYEREEAVGTEERQLGEGGVTHAAAIALKSTTGRT
jgi:hypothetical protein